MKLVQAVNTRLAIIRILSVILCILFVGLSVIANAQDRKIDIKGKVIDSKSGETLPGVNIILKGTSKGTTTNIDGEFEITVPGGNSVLVFSYVGYKSKEIAVDSEVYLNVQLVEDIGSLSEVVVVGYGTQRKADVTSSISSISAEDIQEQTTTNINQALQGRVAGVNITQNSGVPGAGISVAAGYEPG